MKPTMPMGLALLCACSGREAGAVPGPPSAPTNADGDPAAAAIRPGPGVDLEGPVATPASAERRPGRADVKPLDLGADRAVVSVSVPELPGGGSATFVFDEDHRGWAARIPESDALPALAYGGNRIYASGGFDSTSFYAFSATEGKFEWATTALEDNGPTAAIYEEGRVIFNTESCTLFVLDAATGKRLWHKWLGDPTLAQTAVADGLVFAAHPSADGQRLSAYKVKSGDEVWSVRISGELLAAPVVHDDSVYVTTVKGHTYRFLRARGKRVWAKALRATTAPWLSGDELFVSRRAAASKGKEEQIVVAAATGEVLRQHEESDGAYVADVPRNLADWRKVWAFEGSRPVVVGGVRYVAMGGEVRASDPASGAPLWVRRYASGAGKRSVGTVALAGPQVVVSTREGQLYGLDIDTGYTLWAYDLGHSVVAEPIVAKGWVYAATRDGYVIALEVGDAALDGWHMFGGNAHHNGPTG
jgi:outer membrane protein assembly factor BamB